MKVLDMDDTSGEVAGAYLQGTELKATRARVA